MTQENENMNTDMSIKDPELVVTINCNRNFRVVLKKKTNQPNQTPPTFICQGPVRAIPLFDGRIGYFFMFPAMCIFLPRNDLFILFTHFLLGVVE